MIISQKSLDAIVYFEVSSQAYYDKFLQSPTWPQGDSGITIGIGYDLGYNTKDEIQNDWGNYLTDEDLSKLKFVSGYTGHQAQIMLTDSLKTIHISFNIAEKVFSQTSLPKAAKQALYVYPDLSDLMPDACGAIVSLVYNRGNSLEGDKRTEMAAIKPLITAKDYNGIADQILSMKRLWPNVEGLLERRDIEANLVRNAVREYLNDELITI